MPLKMQMVRVFFCGKSSPQGLNHAQPPLIRPVGLSSGTSPLAGRSIASPASYLGVPSLPLVLTRLAFSDSNVFPSRQRCALCFVAISSVDWWLILSRLRRGSTHALPSRKSKMHRPNPLSFSWGHCRSAARPSLGRDCVPQTRRLRTHIATARSATQNDSAGKAGDWLR